MNDAQNHDDRIHALFAQVAADPAPPLGFTADGIAEAGRRGARSRRIAAVSGATAGLAVVGIAVATLPGTGGGPRRDTALTDSTTPGPAASTTAPPDPICAADVAKAFQQLPPDPAHTKLALQMCPALRAIDAVLDPAGKRLAEADETGHVIKPDIVWGAMMFKGKATGTGADLCYDNEGPASAPNQAMCVELPEVTISVTFALPGAPDPSPQSDDLSLADRKPGVGGGSVSWDEETTTTLHDGSRVTISKVQNGDRVAMKARRVLKSGAALTIVATDGYDHSSAIEQPGSVYNPFPFSVGQMLAAASVEQFVPPTALETMPTMPMRPTMPARSPATSSSGPG